MGYPFGIEGSGALLLAQGMDELLGQARRFAHGVGSMILPWRHPAEKPLNGGRPIAWEIRESVARHAGDKAYAFFPMPEQLRSVLAIGRGVEDHGTPRHGSLNFNPTARQQLDELLAADELTERGVNTLCLAALQLTAPKHVEQRLAVLDKLSDALDPRTCDVAGMLDKLMQAASALATPGKSIQDIAAAATPADALALLVPDDVARLPFILKVGQMLSRHGHALGAESGHEALRFQGALERFAGLVPGYAITLQEEGDSDAFLDSRWLQDITSSTEELYSKPLQLAFRQSNFPILDAIGSANNSVRWTDGPAGCMARDMTASLLDHMTFLAAHPHHEAWDHLLTDRQSIYVPDDWWERLSSRVDVLVRVHDADAGRQANLMTRYKAANDNGSATERSRIGTVLDAIHDARRNHTFRTMVPSFDQLLDDRALDLDRIDVP